MWSALEKLGPLTRVLTGELGKFDSLAPVTSKFVQEGSDSTHLFDPTPGLASTYRTTPIEGVFEGRIRSSVGQRSLRHSIHMLRLDDCDLWSMPPISHPSSIVPEPVDSQVWLLSTGGYLPPTMRPSVSSWPGNHQCGQPNPRRDRVAWLPSRSAHSPSSHGVPVAPGSPIGAQGDSA